MLVLSEADRRIGDGSAGGIFVLGLASALTLALGFGSAGTVAATIIEPLLAAMQVELLLMAPLLVLLTAGTTSLVHFVLLTVGRQPDAATGLFPSTAWRADLVAFKAGGPSAPFAFACAARGRSAWQAFLNDLRIRWAVMLPFVCFLLARRLTRP